MMFELSYVSFFFVRKCGHWGWYRLEGAQPQNPSYQHLKDKTSMVDGFFV